MRTWIGFFAVIFLGTMGCSESTDNKSAPVPSAGGVTKVKIALNWKPEPEFGGIYAAQQTGAFGKHGLEVSIDPVGDKAKSLVINGQAEFGIAAADEVLAAREQGADLVAIYTIYQTNPQGIMTHEARGFKDIGEVLASEGTVAVEPGLHYSNYFKQKYPNIKAKFVPYDYAIAKFMIDPNYSQQCFVTSEPLTAKKQGGDPKVFLIADSGYDPYAGLVIVRGDYLKQNPKIVASIVAAMREGWRTYLDDPKPANEIMSKLNPAMDLDTFNLAAKAQESLVETDRTKKEGLGTMTTERWDTLAKQLVDLKQLKKAPATSECFVNPKTD